MASPEALVAALADPARLTLFARICTTPGGLAVPDAATRKLARRLASTGLVTAVGDRYHAVPEAFGQALAKKPADPLDALFKNGRLVTVPRPGRLREALFIHLAAKFEPGRLYTEPEVREVLSAIHDDHALLRRYLVDEGLLQRSRDGSAYGRPAT